MIYAQILVMDLTYKINRYHSLRFETQGMWTDEDKGDWAFGQIEYTFSPHWYLAVLDQYNYGNKNIEKACSLWTDIRWIHTMDHIVSRYNTAKQRAGVFCRWCMQSSSCIKWINFSFTSSF